MNFFLTLITLWILSACSSYAPAPHDGLLISERNPDKSTFISRQNLHHLEQVYNLKAFSYQRNVIIDSTNKDHRYLLEETAIIIGTDYVDSPQKLLALWLHEEFHWWARIHEKELNPALTSLKKYYPKTSQSGRLHLLISYLEFEALRFYLEDKEARSIINSKIKKDGAFKWTYQQVLNNSSVFKKVLRDHKLLPEVLN